MAALALANGDGAYARRPFNGHFTCSLGRPILPYARLARHRGDRGVGGLLLGLGGRLGQRSHVLL